MVRNLNNGSLPVPDRVQRRAEARRYDILRAASKVFRKRGFAAASMREIAAEADLSPGNLYHYFAGKVEILYFCQDRALDRMETALKTARDSGAPAVEQMSAVIHAHLSCMLDELEGSTAHLQVEALPDELRCRIMAKRDRYERAIRRLIEAGIESGEFAACDPTLVTRAVLGALNWTTRWFRPDGRYPADQVGDAFADYLVRGLVHAKLPDTAQAQLAHQGG
jgi:TetR/AcrR family transcriptional regulator, cholesterol catabolism regulator